MSKHVTTKRQTIHDIAAKKGDPEALVCLTAYTAPVARLADHHADLILVGDSLGMVIYGFPSTLSVTMDLMVAHGRAVVNASSRALVVIDMPFGSYQESPEQAFRNAAIIMAETNAQAVKIEGGVEMAATVAFLVERGIPVIGHIGLQPQSVHGAGGYRVTGRTEAAREKILADARALAKAGAFAIVLECIEPGLADEITAAVPVVTIGIGASAGCDGQILVCDDMLGLNSGMRPKFVKHYGEIGKNIDDSFAKYATEVRERKFPSDEYIYKNSDKKPLLPVD